MRVLLAIWVVVLCFLAAVLVYAENAEHGAYPPNPNHAVSASAPNASATPEIGAAAPTFTRATASTTYNTSDLVATVSSGVPTIIRPLAVVGLTTDKIDTAGPTGVRIGEAVTNVCLRNEVLTHATWVTVFTPTVTDDAVVAPDGNTTADRVEDNDGTNVEGLEQDFSVADDSSIWTATVWIKCTSAHDTRIGLGLGGGTPVGPTYATLACSTTWQRAKISVTNNTSGNTALNLFLFPTNSTGSTTGIAEFWRPQVYNENTAVQLDVATAAAAVTVNREQLTYDAVVINDVGTLCTWMWMNSNDVNTRYVAQWDNTHMYRFTINATEQPVFETTKLANNAALTATAAITSEAWHHVCWQWNAALTTQPVPYIDGVATTWVAGGADHTFSTGGTFGTVLDMGAGNAGEYIPSRTVFYNQVIASSYVVRAYNMSAPLYARAPVPRPRDWMYSQLPDFMRTVVDRFLPVDPPMPKPAFAAVAGVQ